MKEEQLTVPFVKRKKYCTYIGKVSPGLTNIIDCDFDAEKPNTKWLTDITGFRISTERYFYLQLLIA